MASRFRASTRGGAALLTALAAPPIFLVALGAIQLQAVVSDKQKTQDVADAAALWGAQQLTITKAGVGDRAIAFANAQLTEVEANAAVTIKATTVGEMGLKLTIDTKRPSFFLNLLPLGGFRTHAEAIAEGASVSPLCVLIIGGSGGDDIKMGDSSKLQGPACLIHSNHAVEAGGSALIQGQQVEAVTTASGPISPSPATGAPPVDDPFGSLTYNPPGLCLLNILDSDFSGTLPATTNLLNVHQFNYKVKPNTTMTLAPGEHYFCGDLELKSGASLVGDDVVMIFAPGTELKLKDGANVNLNGRKTGSLAGFVVFTSGTSDFKIDSDPISNITGTIYTPKAKLIVDGSKRSGAASAWTVLAAKSFEGKGGANLVINANYGGTDVPVPSGVGNRIGETHLTK